MASAAEQLASSFNLGAFSKAKELKQRILFTLLMLVVYRIGTYLPMPNIDPTQLQAFFSGETGGSIGGMLDLFSGGALGRMSIFALNIMPYISASIIMQLMSSSVPRLAELKKEGEAGRKVINQYTRYGAVILAMFQAYGLAVGLEKQAGVVNPEVSVFVFRMVTVITLTTGTVFLMWLGEQITARGIGNGISLIIFTGIVARLPRAFAQVIATGQDVHNGSLLVIGFFILAAAVILFIVFMERAQRRLLVQYPKRQVGNRMMAGQSSHLPLKLNTAGVIPPIFASSLLGLPLMVLNFMGSGANASGFVGKLQYYLDPGKPLFLLLFASLIIFFCFFYTAIVFNPEETSENLRRNGGFVPGIRPGKNTADYLDYVLTRITLIGAIYLVIVCLIPEVLRSSFNVPFYFGGTSLLIVVSVTMDTVTQIHSHLLAHQYEGLIKKNKLRGKRR